MNVRVDGEKLREIRRRKAMERSDVERSSGVHRSTITRLELGQTAMRLSTAKKIADALGVDHEEFAGGEVVTSGRRR